MDKRIFCQQCHMKCPVIARIEDGTITGIDGASCPKGTHAHQLIYHPDRITRPLKRSAGKGEGQWQAIPWEEAYRLMADRFGEIREKHGAEAIAALVEGNSIRATCRMTDTAKGTVMRLLADVGSACAKYQHEHLRDLSSNLIQCDEIWSFCYAKQKNVPEYTRGVIGVGDV